MTHFVGLDVSQKMTAICVVDNAGRRLWRGQCPTVPEQITVLVRRHAGDGARIGIETGAMTPWLVHELRNLGLEVVCLDARHARAALKMQINKRHSSRPSDRMRSISRSIARVSIEAMARRPPVRRPSASIWTAVRQAHDKRVRPRPSPISGSSRASCAPQPQRSRGPSAAANPSPS